ncbi:MAG: phytoene/squalene synthase family protein [Paludibacter sp.]|jgi:phytoene/squalene synthetase|nr:phytoene/squalene synthase family protein [Paludibacter sp.]
MELFHDTSLKTSAIVTKNYSNSFYLSTLLLDKRVKTAIHSIYGFVRFADEIVDTFHGYDKAYLLQKFETDMHEAIENKISLNPILNSFQWAVNEYGIPMAYIDAFMNSMRMDLTKKEYLTNAETSDYIYGSANVVGLMCLKVFCKENTKLFGELVHSAEMLGSAFQKVNFLRDLQADIELLERSYFPQFDKNKFDENLKLQLIAEIEQEFDIALEGIKRLPGRSQLAVYTAYNYYRKLLIKIKHSEASAILKERIRISNVRKLSIMAQSAIEYKLNMI